MYMSVANELPVKSCASVSSSLHWSLHEADKNKQHVHQLQQRYKQQHGQQRQLSRSESNNRDARNSRVANSIRYSSTAGTSAIEETPATAEMPGHACNRNYRQLKRFLQLKDAINSKDFTKSRDACNTIDAGESRYDCNFRHTRKTRTRVTNSCNNHQQTTEKLESLPYVQQCNNYKYVEPVANSQLNPQLNLSFVLLITV